jgi:hypothetical protein
VETVITVSADKPGRMVEVRTEKGMVILEVGGRYGESEWTWLTTSEAKAIIAALQEAVDVVELKVREAA